MILIKKFQEEGRRAGTKPIRSNISCIQCLHQTERIKNIFRILAEMITVVELCQLFQTLLICHIQCFTHSFNVQFHLRGKFCLADAADG